MMRRETAYKLAGRNHYHESELEQELRLQEIRFFALPEGQAERAATLLKNLPALAVAVGRRPNSILVRYDLAHHTLRSIESQIEEWGLHLENSLFAKLRRAFVYFSEDTRCRNARAAPRLLKQSNEVYVKAYEHHPHGDHDDTPPELRDDR